MGSIDSHSKACARGKLRSGWHRAQLGKGGATCHDKAPGVVCQHWGRVRHLLPLGPTGGVKCSVSVRLPPLPAHWAVLCSISLFLGSQKNCSFLGSSVTSTGIASYSSLSMLKEPPAPCGEGKTQQAHSGAGGVCQHPSRSLSTIPSADSAECSFEYLSAGSGNTHFYHPRKGLSFILCGLYLLPEYFGI